MILLTLPMPPSCNRAWRKGRDGQMYLAPAVQSSRDEVWFASRHIDKMSGALSLTMEFYFKTAAGDLDNRIKQLQDALQGRAFENDKQIVELHAYRYEDKKNPRVEVEITSAE